MKHTPRERARETSPTTLVDCSCKAIVYSDGSGVEIEYCPTHEAAPWMRREIERVGDALFTNLEGHYTGTEEDLQCVGQFVEGVCETMDHLATVNAELLEALKALTPDAPDIPCPRCSTHIDPDCVECLGVGFVWSEEAEQARNLIAKTESEAER